MNSGEDGAFTGGNSAFAGGNSAFAGGNSAFAGGISAFARENSAFAGGISAFAGENSAFARGNEASAGENDLSSPQGQFKLDRNPAQAVYSTCISQRKRGRTFGSEDPPLTRNCDWEDPSCMVTRHGLNVRRTLVRCLGRPVENGP
jgi:hypothetical protein